VQRTAQLRDFVDDPVGRALIGDGWLYFCAHPELFGIVFWGSPGAAEMERLVRALTVELRDDIRPHRSLVDASRLEAGDLGAFEVLNRYVVEHARPLSTAVTKLALVRPDGMVGAVTAGFYQVLDSPYPTHIVADAAEGMAWLGEAPELLDPLMAIVRDVRGSTVTTERLRAWLSDHLQDGELRAAAKALAVSERTLQRRLKKAGTTFAQELLEARLSRARQLMRQSDASLSTIALTVGFSSQQHFSTAFRKAFGEPPSSWRAASEGRSS
jgi:AraC-like DNA-binding protein